MEIQSANRKGWPLCMGEIKNMKTTITIGLTIWLAANACGQTQTKLNVGVCNEYKTSDNELNQIYQKILNVYKSDVSFVENLKDAQR